MKAIHKKSSLLFAILLVCLSILPLFDLFHSGLPITHDGQDHVARIANFYLDLQNGSIIPRWAENLNWGYGHPILMFLYPLPSYIASFFHFLGFSFVDSTKLVFGLTFVASGLAMYLWLREFLQKEAAFVGGLLYLFAPYRYVDLYVRGAIGEHVAFVFPPLIMLFLFRISKKNHSINTILGGLSLAGLILAHNAISLMFLPIIFLYSTYLFFQSQKRKIFLIHFTILVVLGFALAAFFWVPAFFEGKYTLRDIVTQGTVFSNFVPFQMIIFSPWNYGISKEFSVQVGIVQWVFVLLSLPVLFLLKRRKDTKWIFLVGTLVIFLFSIFLLTSPSTFIWQHISTLQKFQFPWRFLSVTVFIAAVISAFVFSYVPKKYLLGSIVFVTLAVLFANSKYWHAKAYQNKPEVFYSGIYHSTTDTGESSPIWSVRFMEHIPKSHIEVIGGKATIQEKKPTPTHHEYLVNASAAAKLRENTIYFPGWSITVDGQKEPIEFQDPNNRGVMTFNVPQGIHTVIATFTETKLRFISDMISGITILGVGVFLIFRRVLWRN